MCLFQNQIVKIPKKKFKFHVMREKENLEKIMPNLPESEVYKIISTGGFSSIAFIKSVADKTVINELTVSTLRVGTKHLMVLDNLRKQGRLKNVNFIVGSLMKNDSTVGLGYKYFDNLEQVCRDNNWSLTVYNNHSKILLFDTDDGKFVLETSSNLNKNPNMEHFSFEKNTELYNAYINTFERLFGGEEDEEKEN